MSLQEQIHRVQLHLQHLTDGSVKEVDDMDINRLSNRVTLDKTAVSENTEDIKALLHTVTAVLMAPIEINFSPIVELLDAILSQLDFDSITQQFDLAYLLQALASPNENIQTIALKVIAKAQPVDIIANTEIVPRVLELLDQESTTIKVVSEIENAFDRLFSGELIRRRVLTNECKQTLLHMKNSKQSVILARLLNITTLLLPHLSENESPKELYSFDVILDEDILLTLSLIKFYTDIVDIVDSNLNKQWLLADCSKSFESIGYLYSRKDTNPDIEFFAVGTIETFFKKLSYVSPDLFTSLDDTYIKLTKSNASLLASLNPSYLAMKHAQIVKQIPLTMDNIPIFLNLIASVDSFTLIQRSLTSSQIVRLPYLEVMALTSRLSAYPYSAHYLIHDLPQVMNKILKGDNVIEPETWKLRRRTLENLLKLSHEELDVWHAAVVLEYEKITQGKKINPDVEILDDAL